MRTCASVCVCVSCSVLLTNFFLAAFSFVFILGLLRGCVPMSWHRLQAPQWRKSNKQNENAKKNIILQLHHAECALHRIQFNWIVLFVFRLVRCGFYWTFLLHLCRCEQIYWQYRFSEFLIIAICRFFFSFPQFFSNTRVHAWSLVGSWRSVHFFRTGRFFLWITARVTMFYWCAFLFEFFGPCLLH